MVEITWRTPWHAAVKYDSSVWWQLINHSRPYI